MSHRSAMVATVALIALVAVCAAWVMLGDPYPSNLVRAALGVVVALSAGGLTALSLQTALPAFRNFRWAEHALCGASLSVIVACVMHGPLNSLVKGTQTRDPELYLIGQRHSRDGIDALTGGRDYYWKPVGVSFRLPAGNWRVERKTTEQLRLVKEGPAVLHMTLWAANAAAGITDFASWPHSITRWRQFWAGLCGWSGPPPAMTEKIVEVNGNPASLIVRKTLEASQDRPNTTTMDCLCLLKPGIYSRVIMVGSAEAGAADVEAKMDEVLRSIVGINFD